MTEQDIAFKENQSVVAARFNTLLNKTCCPYAPLARVCFGPEWQLDQSVNKNIRNVVPYFDAFVNRAEIEQLDMFVVEVRDQSSVKSIRAFATLLQQLLVALNQADPLRTGCLTDGIDSPDWDFTYGGARLFVLTFAPFYRERHARYSYCEDTAFITFQPDHSFDRHGINSKSPNRGKVSTVVKEAFEREGIPYDISLVVGSIKAVRYIKPLEIGQPPVRWWEEEEGDKQE